MNRSLVIPAAVALSAAVALGQQAYAPALAATDTLGSSGNYYNSPTTGSRHQSVYHSSHFFAQGIFTPIVVNNLEWRAAGGLVTVPQTWPQVDIWIGYSANDYNALDATFANNRTASHTLVHSGPVTSTAAVGGTPNDWVINLPLTTTFQYDPSLGQDLLIEIMLTGAPTPTGVLTLSTAYDIPAHECQAVRATSSITALVGSLSRFVPAVRLGYTMVPNAATHAPYGKGCYEKGTSFYEVFPAQAPANTTDLSNHTVRMFLNGTGGYDVVTTPGAVLAAIPASVVGLGLPDDGPSAPLPLSFAFPYPGGNSTSTVYAHSNGSVTLNGPGVQFMNNGSNPSDLLNNTMHVLAAAMCDLQPDDTVNVQNVYAWQEPTGEYIVHWDDVPPFIATQTWAVDLSTFQVVLFPSGNVEYRYETIFDTSLSYGGGMVAGFSLGGGALETGSIDLTAQVTSTVYPDVAALKLTGSLRPVLGQPVVYALENMLPVTGIGAMLVSFQQVNPGLPLTGIGVNAPGCSYYINPTLNVPFSGLLLGSPTASFTQTWPVGPWSGVQMFVQGFELAPGQNPIGVIASNGLKAILDIN